MSSTHWSQVLRLPPSAMLKDHFNIFCRFLRSFDTKEDKRAAFLIQLLEIFNKDFSYYQRPFWQSISSLLSYSYLLAVNVWFLHVYDKQ